MALISLRQLLDHAAEHGYGVPAYNVNNMEQMQAIMQAADETDSPVICQASAGARSYAGAPFLRHLILGAVEQWPHIPLVMHQDHGSSPAVCQRSVGQAQFHFDWLTSKADTVVLQQATIPICPLDELVPRTETPVR